MPLFGKHHKNTESTRHGHNDTTGTDYAASQPVGGQAQGGAPMHGNEGFNSGPTHGADPYANPAHNTAGGPGSGLGATGPNPSVPPASHINPNQDSQRSGSGGGRLAGKTERAVGTLVGSQALKEKGFQKEHEAGAFKMQSAEIAEAERLEKEALMRRERAVAHGAHPDNRHLGGLQNANTLDDVAGTGSTGSANIGGGLPRAM
ncbi:hypothetical protein C8Q80DRAFT_1139044 [Daedaleopsis nitida]|nr:hypothetical protein C8Q80DRAFT_1139044 [Daedaleopsis nitida]